MRMVGLTELLEMRNGTLFQRFEPMVFGGLEILGGTLGGGSLVSCPIGDAPLDYHDLGELVSMTEDMAAGGASHPVTLDGHRRDGAVPDGQLFAVWEDADVITLIAQLRVALGTPASEKPEEPADPDRSTGTDRMLDPTDARTHVFIAAARHATQDHSTATEASIATRMGVTRGALRPWIEAAVADGDMVRDDAGGQPGIMFTRPGLDRWAARGSA